MIIIACTSCGQGLRVDGEEEELSSLVGVRSDYWPNSYTCFACGAAATGYLLPEISQLALSTLSLVTVTPSEAFAALNGLGVPVERTCCEEVLTALFEPCGVRLVGRQPRGSTRFFIDALVLPDGTTVHLGAGPQGAVIYRITRPVSYVQAVEGVEGSNG